MALAAEFRARMVMPAVCAPMMMVSGPDLVSAACRAGLMAGLPRHNARSAEEFAGWLDSLNTAFEHHAASHPTEPLGPLAINITNVRPIGEICIDLDLCIDRGVRLFISAMGDPTDLVQAIHDRGGTVFHDVTNLRYAEKAIAAGADGLICIGSGGGGHSGQLNALAFLPQVRAMWDGAIVFAGCVSNGAAIRAAEILGADLAYLGTRFIATQEAQADEVYKSMLLQATAADLIFTDKVSGVHASWLKDSLRRYGLDPDALPTPAGKRRHDHLPEGVRPWRELWSAGQGVGMIDDIPTVAELVDRLRREYAAACAIPSWNEAERLVDMALDRQAGTRA